MKWFLLLSLFVSFVSVAAEKKKAAPLKINAGESSMVKNAKAMKEKHKKTQAQLDEVEDDSHVEEESDSSEEEE